MIPAPDFWKTDLAHIEELAASAQRAEVSVPGTSAGGRPIYVFSYGEKQEIVSSANYSSACGARDIRAYKPAEGKKPVVLLLGAVHGAEVEGTAALVGLIHLLEEGKDLRGRADPELLEAEEGVRLVIVPVCNADGRARFPFASACGMTMEEQRYWFQGTWKDGSLCGWPACKMTHPIKEASGFLGCYFNDDGVNIMHDTFFRPMAKETEYLLDLADREKADYIVQLHGGSNSYNCILPVHYGTKEATLAARDLSLLCDADARREGLRFTVCPVPERESGETPPAFDLASALHHVGGAVSMVFESNQCVAGTPGVNLTHEQIYDSHMILFRRLLRMAKESV